MANGTNMVKFTLNGKEIIENGDETIWKIAKNHGVEIPHLCHKDEPGYRSDGNCRACMVEIQGERVLAASCVRKPKEGMIVNTASDRAKKSRDMLFEVLLVDQPSREMAHDPDSDFWNWVDKMGLSQTGKGTSLSPKLPKNEFLDHHIKPDNSHSAIAVNLDACINCGLCVRACREVQANDVIGMAGRGAHSKVIFDFDQAMGSSTCVACGECVQVCPTGALMEANLLDKSGVLALKADREVDTLCPYCGVGCQTKVYVKEDKIIKVDGRNGPANENRLCVKGRFGYDYVHHQDRLTKPLIRKADAPSKHSKVLITKENRDQYFREASWDEALKVAGQGLTKIYQKEGGKGLAGFGSAKGSNEEAYLFQKLFRQGFLTNNVDHCTRLCHASSVAALMEGLNSGAVSAPFGASADSEVIIVIGARPAENHPVAATYIKNAAAKGATLIVMDPRGQNQGISRYASHVLQFKPGSDVALLNAMIHTIIKEGITNPDYIKDHVDGYEALVANIDKFTPEAMTKICGIAPDVIRTVARLYAKSKASLIFWGMGVSQHVHGTDNARALIALALITGQIGRNGAGLHPLRGQNNVQGASDAGLIPMVYPDYQKVGDPASKKKFENAWLRDLDAMPGLTVVEIIDAIHDDIIKGMYIMGENPAMSDPDQNHAREALAMLEHLVVQDIFLTETACYADVIFPASAHAEKYGTFTNTNREIQIGRPVLPLPGDARQDWLLIQQLANEIGLDWNYSGPDEICAEMSELMPSRNNISWQRLEKEGSVTYPSLDPNLPGSDIIFTKNFPTASGRAKIVTTQYLPPDELPDQEYPFVLTTGRLLEHWHTGSMTRRSTTLDALEPEAIACLNQYDMKTLKIMAGNFIEVSTRRGNIKLKVRMDRDVPEGMIFIPFCFNEAAANLLTNPKLDPFGKIPEFKYCAAKLRAVA